jgi:long-chain acyl-CoA synthetase
MNTEENLVTLFEASIRKNWERPALSDLGGGSFVYGDVARQILYHHSIFAACGIKKGDKVALLGKNSATWGIIYLSTITYGAVIVPLLPDFKPKDIQYILGHSDSVALFAEEILLKELDFSSISGLMAVLGIPGHQVFYSRDESISDELLSGVASPADLKSDLFSLVPVGDDEICEISYTSGTTGYSKGVVLQHKSLLANILYAHRNMPLQNTDSILSFLPMAHAFGCTFEFLFPFTLGCHITFLNKIPSPTTIINAFGEIRPALILTVPLTIEKIYKNRISPTISQPLIRILIHVPLINRIILMKIYKKLYDLFGGRLRELVIGGAPLNHTVEKFFRKIRFPYTVGYGMTECGPLISYAAWKTTPYGAAGRIVNELELRVDSPDPLNIPGEILVRGRHVMLGYYKNDEATREVLDEDGWLHTGDMATVDNSGNIFIRGRTKSMLLGPSGQNIYPEELESILNNMPLVLESLVVQRDHKLTALIFPDADAMSKAGVKEESLDHVMKGYIHDLNHQVPKYMRIADFEIRKAEFEKTPKRNPKRFLYV